MKDKILINLYVLKLNKSYDLFVPVNEKMFVIKNLIIKAITELTDGVYNDNSSYLFDPDTGLIYNDNLLLLNTNINNSKKIILI